MIEVDNITKSFGNLQAVKGVSFKVNKGEIFGLLGPNGAGKSTTIKIMVTLLKSNSGFVKINGFDVKKEHNEVRKSIGIIFQDPSLDERLTAWENLYFHSKLYHIPKKLIKERIENALDLVELKSRKNDMVLTFSGGMKRRLEIARGILHTPKLLFLDEPTIGLDPQTRKNIWNYIVSLRNNQNLSVFLTTHYMEEAEICDRVAIMDHGEIIALDTPANLKNTLENDIITISTDNNIEISNLIRDKFNLETIIISDSIKISVKNGQTFLPQLFETFSGRINEVDIKKPTLEDVFIKLTGRKIREEEASSTDKLRSSIKRRGRK